MKKFQGIPTKIGIAIVVIIFIYIFIKGSIVTIWLSPPEPTTYALYGQNDRDLKIILLPENQVLFWYQDKNVEESTLTHMRGSYGINYFWRFWKLEGPHISLGYRIYPSDVKPVVMEIETKQKYFEGQGDSSFPKVGDTSYSTLLFGNDRLRFEDMWLQNEPTDYEFVEATLEKIQR